MSTVLSAVGEATGLKPDDKVIAGALLAGAKVKAMAYCGAALESTNPEVRHVFTSHLQASLAAHERMTKLMMQRGWYSADASAQELLQEAVTQAKPVLQ